MIWCLLVQRTMTILSSEVTMKYLAIALLLGGCATNTKLSKLEAKVDLNTYHLRAQSCRSDGVVCLILSAISGSNEIDCAATLQACLQRAQDLYGKEVEPLFP